MRSHFSSAYLRPVAFISCFRGPFCLHFLRIHLSKPFTTFHIGHKRPGYRPREPIILPIIIICSSRQPSRETIVLSSSNTAFCRQQAQTPVRNSRVGAWSSPIVDQLAISPAQRYVALLVLICAVARLALSGYFVHIAQHSLLWKRLSVLLFDLHPFRRKINAYISPPPRLNFHLLGLTRPPDITAQLLDRSLARFLELYRHHSNAGTSRRRIHRLSTAQQPTFKPFQLARPISGPLRIQ